MRGKKQRDTLKNYWTPKTKLPDITHISGTVDKESDRAFVIILASWVEDTLSLTLKNSLKHVNSITKQNLFGHQKPLSSFSAQIDVAYALKLISKDTHESLHILREMRNACAHSTKELSFSTPELSDMVPILEPRLDFSDVLKRPASPDQKIKLLRSIIYMMCGVLMNTIVHGEKYSFERSQKIIEESMSDAFSP